MYDNDYNVIAGFLVTNP